MDIDQKTFLTSLDLNNLIPPRGVLEQMITSTLLYVSHTKMISHWENHYLNMR